jgi:outer membrane scaffolding protein for murein synthesis (MipA/OmpV family)
MRRALAVWCALAVSAPAAAGELPLWELGAGVGAFALPDYRGSDEARGYVLPVPYAVYRGEFLKADRHGIRGELFESERVELNLSVAASLPVNSSRNEARAGMPDLDPSVEVGPSLELALWRSGDGRGLLELRLPLRAAFTLESSPRAIGWVATPNLNLDLPGRGALAGWNFGFLAGPVYGSRRQHEYFYGVAPQFGTPERPAYAAPGGYAGLQFLAAASRRFAGIWVGAFVRADTLRGAAFEASPLVKRDSYFAAGAAIAWVLGVSRERVAATE